MLSMSNGPSQKGRRKVITQINHMSSHMNALRALSLNVSTQDLMLNHLMLATIDYNATRMGANHRITRIDK